MTFTKTLVYALALCLSLVSVAEAKGRSGSSFKGGFSSQRQKAPKPAPSYQAPANSYQAPASNYQAPKPAQTTKPAFGSFGSNKAAQTQAGSNQPPSQMSRDMNSANAQANAQRNWDARNKPQAADSQAANAGKSDSGWFRSGNQGGNSATPPPNYGQASQAGQYRTERRGGNSGGGFWNGVMWFMLGNSLAHNSNAAHANAGNVSNTAAAPATVVQPTDGSMDLGPADDAQATGVAENNAVIDQSAADNLPAAEPETESAVVSLLRALLWTLVAVVVFWSVRGLMRIRNRMNNRRRNYSLGN